MITIVDYGLGNIKAFQHIYNQLNLECSVASDSAALQKATKILLPGVGSFDYAMSLLDKSGMRHTLDDLVLMKKVPVLGVCVGMQILSNGSEEGDLDGLGYVDGFVKKFSEEQLLERPLPHMGWNTVEHREQDGLLRNISNSERFYFLHSYYFECNQQFQIIGSTIYGTKFTCSVRKENIYGVQFHPEKSHDAGVNLLANFGLM